MSVGAFLLKARQWLTYGGSFKLRAYEETCIETWKKTLSSEALRLLNEQMKRLNFYQRQGNEKLLCFYDLTDKAAAHWPEEILFPCKLDEATVARFQLRPICGGPKNLIKVDVTLCHGRFFGLGFNKPPKPLQSGVEVVKVETLLDPMMPIREKSTASGQREQLLAAIDAKLPIDYLDLASNSGGVTINNWQIYDLAHVRKVVQPIRNYYLLAEKDGCGAIGVAEEDQSGEIFYLDYEDEKPVKIRTSFREFLQQERKCDKR